MMRSSAASMASSLHDAPTKRRSTPKARKSSRASARRMQERAQRRLEKPPMRPQGKQRFEDVPVFSAAGFRHSTVTKISEPIQDLVGPEALEAMQRLVQCREFLARDAADLLDGLDVLLVQ